MMKNKKLLILTLIMIMASTLRLWGLGNTPPSPDWDEASLGYNAYSLLSTGKDEYGESLPIILRSFGDYKPALYSYLAIPSIVVFDLNTFAVRLPSAIFGIFTVFITYLLVKKLVSLDSKVSEDRDYLLPLIAAGLLAISPWHIQFSRVAFESNIGLALNVFAVTAFVYGLKKSFSLSFSAVFLGLSLYAYQSEKVFVPLLFLVLVTVFYRRLKMIPLRHLILAFTLGALVALPMGIAFIQDSSNTFGRAKGVSVFSAQSESFKANSEKILRDKINNDLVGQIFDNRRIYYVREIAQNYLSHWNINWLFVNGDIGRHHAPNMGLLYLFELPFVFIGIYFLIFGKYPKEMKWLILLWFLIAPLPASVTTGVPHAVRTLNFLPTFQIFTAIGLFGAYQWATTNFKFKIKRIKPTPFLLFALLFLYLFNFIYYLDQYFVQQNYFSSEDWQYGYSEAVDVVKENYGSYDKIVVSNSGYLDQSYIFFLFYLKYPPRDYQEQGGFIGKSTTDRKVGKFEFRKINWEIEKNSSNTLFVGSPEELENDGKVISSINFLNGKPAIKIVGTR